MRDEQRFMVTEKVVNIQEGRLGLSYIYNV